MTESAAGRRRIDFKLLNDEKKPAIVYLQREFGYMSMSVSIVDL